MLLLDTDIYSSPMFARRLPASVAIYRPSYNLLMGKTFSSQKTKWLIHDLYFIFYFFGAFVRCLLCVLNPTLAVGHC